MPTCARELNGEVSATLLSQLVSSQISDNFALIVSSREAMLGVTAGNIAFFL